MSIVVVALLLFFVGCFVFLSFSLYENLKEVKEREKKRLKDIEKKSLSLKNDLYSISFFDGRYYVCVGRGFFLSRKDFYLYSLPSFVRAHCSFENLEDVFKQLDFYFFFYRNDFYHQYLEYRPSNKEQGFKGVRI